MALACYDTLLRGIEFDWTLAKIMEDRPEPSSASVYVRKPKIVPESILFGRNNISEYYLNLELTTNK